MEGEKIYTFYSIKTEVIFYSHFLFIQYYIHTLAIIQSDRMSAVHMKASQWNLLALWLNYHSIILNIDAYLGVGVKPLPAVTCTVFLSVSTFLIISHL